MASIGKLIKHFVRSPRGQRLIWQLLHEARRPHNRRKLEELRWRYMRRRRY
jgi:hypothetical protein